jgi:hypothetical protein
VNPAFLWGTSLLPAIVLLVALPLALLSAARLSSRIPGILDASRRLPLRSFLVGLLAAVAVLLLLSAAGASPVFGIPALLAGTAAAALGFLGLVAEARGLGGALRGRSPRPGEIEGGSVAVGWLVIAGLPLLAVAGPLAVLYLGIRGVGASIIAMTAGEAAS